MSDRTMEAETDTAAVGAALLLADLHDAVAAAAGEIASFSQVLGSAIAGVSPVPADPVPPTQVPSEPASAAADQVAVVGSPRQPPDVPQRAASPATAEPQSLTPMASVATAAAPLPTPVPPAALAADRTSPTAAVVSEPAAPLMMVLPSRTGPVRVETLRSVVREERPSATTAPTAWAEPAAPPSVATNMPLQEAAPAPQAAAPPQAWAQPASSAAAPATPWSSPVGSPRDAAMAASFGAASAAPPPRAGSGPTGGDVILDGMRVGRWIADTLAREAAGPAMGSTAFDPRLGPTWPGALQGN